MVGGEQEVVNGKDQETERGARRERSVSVKRMRAARGRLLAGVRACLTVGAVMVAAGAAHSAPNQFVILSDMHRYPPEERQMTRLTEQLLELRPALVVTLGDMDTSWESFGDELIEGNMPQMFQRLLEAGIEIYPCMGNHDSDPRKNEFFCTHEPVINPQFDPEINPMVHDRWCRNHEYWYSWNRWGIHFVVLQTSSVRDKQKMLDWLEDDLCRHVSNPNRFPTVVFLHYARWIICEHRCNGPLYQLLERCPENTVAAVFGGDSHRYRNYPADSNLGIQVYETTAATHWEIPDPEYIVATVHSDRITFHEVDTRSGGPGNTDAVYYPIEGEFDSLEERSDETEAATE